MKKPVRNALLDPLFDNNPIALQVLGICSALAVSTQVSTAFVMSVAVLGVMAFTSVAVSSLRNFTPPNIRIITELAIITSLVIVTDQVLKAFFFEMSLKLSVFVGLIITNCMVMGRAEAFAMHNPPARSLADAVGNALGYGLVLMSVAALRELFATGRIAGFTLLAPIDDGGWYVPNGLMAMAPAAFLLIGCFIWAVRAWKPEQIEEEFHAGALFEPRGESDLR
jgi:Na+-transporting NADH:ubiquinone oxidoreductase subunit D